MVCAEVLPKVEYELIEFGRTLEPVVTSLVEWGEAFSARPDGTRPA